MYSSDRKEGDRKMIKLLQSIVNTISSVIGFVTHTIQSFLNLLSAIPKFTTYIFNLINSLIPDILKPFIILSIIISIVLLILGRNK